MNWLAHLLISESHIDYQLGNVLADPLKGRSWEGASAKLQQGLKMHARIDAFTDTHELVARSKSRLGERGYLKAVVVDLAYDYLLVKNWDYYVKPDLNGFLGRFYEDARRAVAVYPDYAREFVLRLIVSEHLTSYGSMEGLQRVFARVDARLSSRVRARESISDYLVVVNTHMNDIEQDFMEFFPQLVRYFKSQSAPLGDGHWLR